MLKVSYYCSPLSKIPYTIAMSVGTIYFAPISSATTNAKAPIALVAYHQSGSFTPAFISSKEIYV